MTLEIRTTGVDEYLPGSDARIKVLVVGGPGVGKTRWSSFWPSPFYLVCERGLASIADRGVRYVEVKDSSDMLAALKYLEHDPDAKVHGTVVVDTFDGYQRRVMDEWLRANPHADTFAGREAWGYLDSKMNMLLSRLLKLECNVIVLCHFKEHTVSTRVGNDTVEHTEYQLQLKGEFKMSAFNEFDLIGFMDSEFRIDQESGEHVEHRWLTFQKTPLLQFLKDRLHIRARMPQRVPVTFSDADYKVMFQALVDRLDGMPDSGVVGRVPDIDEEAMQGPVNIPSPQDLTGSSGALAPQAPQPPKGNLMSLNKADLLKVAGQMGVEVDSKLTKSAIVELLDQPAPVTGATPVAPEASAPALRNPCEDCSAEEADGNIAEMAQIKFGRRLGPDCYEAAKRAA